MHNLYFSNHTSEQTETYVLSDNLYSNKENKRHAMHAEAMTFHKGHLLKN